MCRRPAALFAPPIRRSAESPKRSIPFSLRLGDSAVKRFGGNVFRRFVCTLRSDRADCAVRRADRRIGPIVRCGARIGGSASYPNRRNAEKCEKVGEKCEKVGEKCEKAAKIAAKMISPE